MDQEKKISCLSNNSFPTVVPNRLIEDDLVGCDLTANNCPINGRENELEIGAKNTERNPNTEPRNRSKIKDVDVDVESVNQRVEQNSQEVTCEKDAAARKSTTTSSRSSTYFSSHLRESDHKFLKVATVKYLQAIDHYLHRLTIISEKEITSDHVIEALSLRLDAIDATVAKSMMDLKTSGKTFQKEFLDQITKNSDWIRFTLFIEHLIDLFRQLWIALRKPLYAPIPYELLLNSTLRTEIDVNFKHEQNKFYPNSLKNFLNSADGEKFKKKVESLLETEKNRNSDGDENPVAPVAARRSESNISNKVKKLRKLYCVDKSLTKKRVLQDIERPRKQWLSEMLRLMTKHWEEGGEGEVPGDEDSIDQSRTPRNLNDHQLMNLLKRNYIACDNFDDCTSEMQSELRAMRRRNKLRLLDAMRKEKNTMYLKLMKDKIGFEVDGFVKADVENSSVSSTEKLKEELII